MRAYPEQACLQHFLAVPGPLLFDLFVAGGSLNGRRKTRGQCRADDRSGKQAMQSCMRNAQFLAD